MKPTGTARARKKTMTQVRRPLDSKPRRPAGNLVAEIVDQITRKQSAAGVSRQPLRASGQVCSFCLESPVTGSAYRLILKCGAGEPPSSDP
jgi:hypothetical protein